LIEDPFKNLKMTRISHIFGPKDWKEDNKIILYKMHFPLRAKIAKL
jgi:hypothetical protein